MSLQIEPFIMIHKYKFHKKYRAFTLAELLVAMSVLAIIATFSMTKVFFAFQEDKQILLYKDTVTTLNNMLWEAHLNNELRETSTGPEIISYFQNHLSAAKVCLSDATSEGCTGPPIRIYDQKPGFLTHSGVGISFSMNELIPLVSWGGGPIFQFRVDLDGPTGANSEGSDIFHLVCWMNNTVARAKFKCFPDDSWEDGTMWTKAFVNKKSAGSPGWAYHPQNW